jgi:acyl-coenzyme A synthetase/AMP-(fatty) acid ligase
VALESMIITHPDILEAAIVALKDEKWGERPKAYITVREGKDLKGQDVIQWAKDNSNISRFMVPAEVGRKRKEVGLRCLRKDLVRSCCCL